MASYETLTQIRKDIQTEPVYQFDEYDVPRYVITHEPELSQTLGSVHPDACLFMKAINADLAHVQHTHFRDVVHFACGARVLTVREVLMMGCDNPEERHRLEEFAAQCITYKLADGVSMTDLTPAEQSLLTDDYKSKTLKNMSPSQLVDIIMLQPTVLIERPQLDRMVARQIITDPLTNIIFCRDQQITTGAGVVMGAMTMVQRQMEGRVLEFVFNKLGLTVAGHIPAAAGARLEGGDYIPTGDKVWIGCGLRTNMEAIDYMLKNDLFKAKTVCVVMDSLDKNMDRMHLDTVCGFLDKENVLLSDDIIGKNSPIHRTVTEYTFNPDTKQYSITSEGTEFSEYLTAHGYHIIPIPARLQLICGCNIFPIGKGKSIMCNAEAYEIVKRDQHFKGEVICVDYSEIVAMYGGVHCSTFAVRHHPEFTPKPDA